MPARGARASRRRPDWRGPAPRTLLSSCGALVFLAAVGWMIVTWGSGGFSTPAPSAAPASPTVTVPAVVLPSKQKPARLFTGADPFGAGSYIPSRRASGEPGARLRLQDIRGHENDERAVLRSGGRRYVAYEGERFAGSFFLIDAWGPCATLVHEGRLTLCVGDSTTR
ncbi:hypothetical protein BH18ACT15_BH18ACT15_08620 [soil metagenome]